MRKVIVKIEDPQNRYKEIEKEAWFHGWGTRVVEFTDGNAVPETMAIVESAGTGQVKMIDPENVRFVDKPEQLTAAPLTT